MSVKVESQGELAVRSLSTRFASRIRGLPVLRRITKPKTLSMWLRGVMGLLTKSPDPPSKVQDNYLPVSACKGSGLGCTSMAAQREFPILV